MMEQMKDDLILPVQMGKLEIEPVKNNVAIADENPFLSTNWKSNLPHKSSNKSWKCMCEPRKKDATIPIYKKKSKVIKEPTLRYFRHCKCSSVVDMLKEGINLRPHRAVIHSEPLNENMLCQQVERKMKFSLESDTVNVVNDDINKESSRAPVGNNKESSDKAWSGSSCSQEALNPPCDVTIDELASYFETLVHIPKKMSSMAEMMYI